MKEKDEVKLTEQDKASAKEVILQSAAKSTIPPDELATLLCKAIKVIYQQ